MDYGARPCSGYGAQGSVAVAQVALGGGRLKASGSGAVEQVAADKAGRTGH
jgi:hypothetical protein